MTEAHAELRALRAGKVGYVFKKGSDPKAGWDFMFEGDKKWQAFKRGELKIDRRTLRKAL